MEETDVEVTDDKREALTSSRMGCLLTCPRKHYYQYELNLHRTLKSDALRFGTAFHAGLAEIAAGKNYEEAFKAAVATAQGVNALDVQTCAVLAGLLQGYAEHYAAETAAAFDCTKMQPEVPFRYRIAGSLTFSAAGVIDGLATLKDGRRALIEHKTCSEDIGDGAEYWTRLRFNQQLYQYIDALWASGMGDFETVIYDVIRKPSIRVKNGESPEAFRERLYKDCMERPGFYFARRELTVLDQDVATFREQRLTIGRIILFYRAAQKRTKSAELAWPRNCGFTCKTCEFAGFCLQNITVSAGNPPSGFEVQANPELQ